MQSDLMKLPFYHQQLTRKVKGLWVFYSFFTVKKKKKIPKMEMASYVEVPLKINSFYFYYYFKKMKQKTENPTFSSLVFR